MSKKYSCNKEAVSTKFPRNQVRQRLNCPVGSVTRIPPVCNVNVNEVKAMSMKWMGANPGKTTKA